MASEPLEIVRLRPHHIAAFITFFDVIRDHGLDEMFHPHPFTEDEAKRLAVYDGQDMYYLLLHGDEIIGYGMLRGWDEGFDIPSLGIIIHPRMQARGFGRLLMTFLHAMARLNDAKKVRLTVNRQNIGAKKLYESLGYSFREYSASSLVGWLKLE